MRRVLLLVIPLALSLFAAEMILRATGRAEFRSPPEVLEDDASGALSFQPSAVPGLAYELVPDRSRRWRRWQITANSYGMRDREPTPMTDDLVRVAVLGDSVTFGWGLEAWESYPDRLEVLLNDSAADPTEFDVLNFGVVGYSSRDEALVMEHKVMPWRPDVLIIGYVLNDPETSPIQPLQAAFSEVAWWQRSHLLRLIAQVAWEADVRRSGDGDYHRYLHAEGGRWDSVVEAFTSIERQAAALEIPVLLAIFPQIPMQGESWKAYPYAGVHRQVADLARARGFHVIDLYPALDGRTPRNIRVGPHDGHPNWRGQVIAARRIYRALLPLLPEGSVVPPSPPPPSQGEIGSGGLGEVEPPETAPAP